MSNAGRITGSGWEHDEGAHRVEHVCAYNPELADRVGSGADHRERVGA